MTKWVSHQSIRNVGWRVNADDDGLFHSEAVKRAVLLDIREELRLLNRVMQCSNVAHGFRALAKIAARDERAFKRRVASAVRKRLKRKGPK